MERELIERAKNNFQEYCAVVHSHLPEGKETDISEPIRYISKIAKKRGIVFIISDFIAENFEKPLQILKRKHDVILVNISDFRETVIPDIGYAVLEDEETGEQVLVNTSDINFRKEYEKLSKENLMKETRNMRKISVDMIALVSGKPYEIPIRKFFRMREKRMVR